MADLDLTRPSPSPLPALPPLPSLPDSADPVLTVGVLALQGAYAEHISSLSKLNSPCRVAAIAVRTAADLFRCSGLVIPGGESTAIALIASRQREPALDGGKWTFWDFLKAWTNEGRPTWGTCAGMILLATEVVEGSKKRGGQQLLGGLTGVKVVRNQWGRQTESFECPLEVQHLSDASCRFPGTFIRAPVVFSLPSSSSCSQGGRPVEVLARVPRQRLPVPPQGAPTLGPDADVVALRQGNLLACSFHPEVSDDLRFGEYWIKECVLQRPS